MEDCSSVTPNIQSMQTHIRTYHSEKGHVEKDSGEFVVFLIKLVLYCVSSFQSNLTPLTMEARSFLNHLSSAEAIDPSHIAKGMVR
jgi:hypothetical protein